uniref:Tachykinin-related peptide GLGNNAFLGVR-amide n=1 Tax=Delia radicum TaxID=30064 RepID=TRP2_DELRA|nr:RecName: Full=Tachykinin-related peptide GLGNNAFLGVR-amide [Delia radicum]
GLGNNAFLGVR